MAAPLAIVAFFTALFGFIPRVDSQGWEGLIAFIGAVLLVPILLLGLGQVVAAAFLLAGSRMARGFVIAYGILHLINIPVGSFIGAYTLWALLRPAPAGTAVLTPPAGGQV